MNGHRKYEKYLTLTKKNAMIEEMTCMSCIKMVVHDGLDRIIPLGKKKFEWVYI